MKKLISKYAIGTMACFTFVFSACTDLNEKVYSDLPYDDYLLLEQAMLVNTSRVYTHLQSYPEEQTLWTITETSSDEVAVPTRTDGEWNDQGRWKQFQTHEIDPTNNILRKAWEFVAAGIATCNDVISDIEKSPMEDSRKAKYRAEAKVARALYYCWFAEAWGNVPFIESAASQGLPAQKNRQFIMSFIEQEIKENIAYLSDKPTSESYGRITKAVANVLLAKIYLNSDVWFGTPRYDEAIAACDAIIDDNFYRIENNYFTNFQIINEVSSENIFVIPYDKVYTKDKFYWFTLTLNDASRSTYLFSGNMWDGFVVQPDFVNLFDDADTRKKALIYGQQYDKQGNPIVIDGANFIYDPNIANYADRKKWEGARIGKYEFQEGLEYGLVNMENDFVLFRYADVLYMKLEALWRKNGTAGAFLTNADLQKIRTRANMPVYTASDLTSQELLDEFGREFSFEGRRRQDLIRFAVWNKPWWSKPSTPPNQVLFPIPKSALDANPNLVQNP